MRLLAKDVIKTNAGNFHIFLNEWHNIKCHPSSRKTFTQPHWGNLVYSDALHSELLCKLWPTPGQAT